MQRNGSRSSSWKGHRDRGNDFPSSSQANDRDKHLSRRVIPTLELSRDTRSTAAGAVAAGNSSARKANAQRIASRPNREKTGMVASLCGMGDFVRRLRMQARFGALSRAPLRLMRVVVGGVGGGGGGGGVRLVSASTGQVGCGTAGQRRRTQRFAAGPGGCNRSA